MLVLTRRVDQEIIVGGDIRLRVLSTRGNSVRLGIEAPEEIRIKRGELDENDAPQPPPVGLPASVHCARAPARD